MKSYVKVKNSFFSKFSELYTLFRKSKENTDQEIESLISNMDGMRRTIEAKLEKPLVDLDFLEIGPGQKFPYMYYFSRLNNYTGIDLDTPMRELSFSGIWKLWHSNGSVRAIKTIGRKALGIDKAFKQGMIKRLGPAQKKATLLKMDAAALKFDEHSFDCVFSISVFEHLTDPLSVIKEIDRVLRPGGLAIIAIHLYTSDSGIHDPRLFGNRGDIPYWSHLRPQFKHLVTANSYLNEIRMSEFEELFDQHWKNPEYEYFTNDDLAKNELVQLRADGELREYSDDELLASTFNVIWRKPI